MFAATLLLFATSRATAQNVPKEVVRSFEKGDAKGLSEHLNESLEMNILDQKHMVSRNQAVRILQEFFKDHPPTAFKVTYDGVKSESKYSLCDYHTRKEKYRIHIYFMEEKNTSFIYFMSIEKI